MLIYAEPRFEHLTLSMATQTTSHKMDLKQENADFLYWIPILNSLEGDEISDFYYCLVRPENWKDWKKNILALDYYVSSQSVDRKQQFILLMQNSFIQAKVKCIVYQLNSEPFMFVKN